MEALVPSFLTFVSVISAFYAIRLLTKREVNLSRFSVGYQQDTTEEELEKKQKARELPASRVLLLVFSGGATVGLATYTVVGVVWLSALASLLGLLAPWLWLRWHRAGQKKLIITQLEQAAEIIAAVLRSGGGLPAALEKASQEVGNPLKKELAQATAEIRLGVPSAVAFKNLTERINLEEMDILAMAVDLQSTGMAVNMASVFQQIQNNIREKQAFEEEVSSITSENRMAVWIVAAVPFGTIGLLRQLAPDFIAPLFETAIGITIFIISVGLIIFGIFWSLNIAKVSK
ncbi:MAG: type II secretion system F family protein [Thermosipho sp. (in: Bacteria)]|nr:type II secretion system F family protein [Thermosipho sp. (in: thermotogales)]